MLNFQFAIDPTPEKFHEHKATTQEALDTSHIQKEYDSHLDLLKTNIQEKLNYFNGDHPTPEWSVSMRKEFESLKYHANQAVELLKQRDNFRIIPYQQRYKTALQQTTHPYNKIEYKDFQRLEQALDNTVLVDAFPHEATLFKLGILYHLRSKNLIAERIGIYSILIRENSVMDACKLSIEGEKINLVSGWELAKNVYERLLHEADEDTRKAFKKSCERFERLSFLEVKTVEISERLARLKQNYHHSHTQYTNHGEQSDLSIDLPQVPEHAIEVFSTSHQRNECIQPVNTSHDYFHFPLEKTLFKCLNSAVPDHKKQEVFFCHIQAVRLETFIQACLSKIKKGLSGAESRTARNRFIIKLTEITAEARQAIDDESRGRRFDPYDFYATYCAEPENTIKKIHTIYEEYQADQKKIIPCHFQGERLTQAFITHMEKKLFPPTKEASQIKPREILEIDKKQQEEWEKFKNFLFGVDDPADILLYGPSEEAGALAIVPKNKLKQSYQFVQTLQKEAAAKEKSIKKGENVKYKNNFLFSLFEFKKSRVTLTSHSTNLRRS